MRYAIVYHVRYRLRRGVIILKRLALLLFILLTSQLLPFACSAENTRNTQMDEISIYSENNKLGFIRAEGAKLTSPIYDEVLPFRNGCALVKREGFWGCIDDTGKEMIPCEFESIQIAYSDESDMRFIVSSNNAKGILNENNETICEIMYDNIRGFYNGSAIIECDGLMGLIDINGNTLVTPQWEWIYYISDGWALVSFDAEGESVFSFVNSENERMKDTYTYAEPFSEGIAYVMTDSTDTFINSAGESVLLGEWDGIHDRCSQSLIGVCKNDLWGYSLPSGEITIDLCWDEAFPFSPDGIAMVTKDEKYGFINKSGHLITDIRWTDAFDFCDGYAIVAEDNCYGIIDTNGDIIVPTIWSDIIYPSEGLIGVQNADGLWGFIDLAGKIVIDFQYQSVLNSFDAGYAQVICIDETTPVWINHLGKVLY